MVGHDGSNMPKQKALKGSFKVNTECVHIRACKGILSRGTACTRADKANGFRASALHEATVAACQLLLVQLNAHMQ